MESASADRVVYSVYAEQNGATVAAYTVVATYAGTTPDYALAPN